MPKPTMEAPLADRNAQNIEDFLINLNASVFTADEGAIKRRSGLSDEAYKAIIDYDIANITLADILAYANATNSYLDLMTDLDS